MLSTYNPWYVKFFRSDPNLDLDLLARDLDLIFISGVGSGSGSNQAGSPPLQFLVCAYPAPLLPISKSDCASYDKASLGCGYGCGLPA